LSHQYWFYSKNYGITTACCGAHILHDLFENYLPYAYFVTDLIYALGTT